MTRLNDAELRDLLECSRLSASDQPLVAALADVRALAPVSAPATTPALAAFLADQHANRRGDPGNSADRPQDPPVSGRGMEPVSGAVVAKIAARFGVRR